MRFLIATTTSPHLLCQHGGLIEMNKEAKFCLVNVDLNTVLLLALQRGSAYTTKVTPWNSQKAARHLTACQYRQLRTGFSQSIVKTPGHKVPQGKCKRVRSVFITQQLVMEPRKPETRDAFLTINSLRVCLSFRGFEVHKYYTVSTTLLAISTMVKSQQILTTTNTHNAFVCGCRKRCPGKWLFGSKLGNYRDHSDRRRLGAL